MSCVAKCNLAKVTMVDPNLQNADEAQLQLNEKRRITYMSNHDHTPISLSYSHPQPPQTNIPSPSDAALSYILDQPMAACQPPRSHSTSPVSENSGPACGYPAPVSKLLNPRLQIVYAPKSRHPPLLPPIPVPSSTKEALESCMGNHSLAITTACL